MMTDIELKQLLAKMLPDVIKEDGTFSSFLKSLEELELPKDL